MHLFTADRTQYIIMSNTPSLYSCVMYGKGITDDSRFIERVLSTIREFMEDDGQAFVYQKFIAPSSATVSFAKACLVGGERIPHLVIQGEQGPYMVLLLPGRRLDSAIPLALPSESLVGHILPAGGGSIAVLGVESAELEQIETTVASAINWTI